MATDTLKKIVALTQTRLAEETAVLHVHDTIAGILESKWEGKKITKRIEADVRKALTGVYPPESIHFVEGFGESIEISIWGAGTPWRFDDRRGFSLGYRAVTPIMGTAVPLTGRRAAFEAASPATGRGARERIAQRTELLATPSAMVALANAIDAKLAADQALETLLDTEYPENVYSADRFAFQEMAGKLSR